VTGRYYCKRRCSQENLENWKEKPLHWQFLRDTVDSIDLSFQLKWLSTSNLKKKTEGFIFACQNQAIPTNLIKVRIFQQPGSQQETVDHLLTSCSVIALSFYKKLHDAIAKLVHWELAKRGPLRTATGGGNTAHQLCFVVIQ